MRCREDEVEGRRRGEEEVGKWMTRQLTNAAINRRPQAHLELDSSRHRLQGLDVPVSPATSPGK